MRKTEEGFRDLKREYTGESISGGSDISDILNTAVESGTWTAVELPTEGQIACKGILAGMRDGSNWKLSHLSDGARYRTVAGTFAMDIAKGIGKRLFYVQSVEASGTLETVLLD